MSKLKFYSVLFIVIFSVSMTAQASETVFAVCETPGHHNTWVEFMDDGLGSILVELSDDSDSDPRRYTVKKVQTGGTVTAQKNYKKSILKAIENSNLSTKDFSPALVLTANGLSGRLLMHINRMDPSGPVDASHRNMMVDDGGYFFSLSCREIK